MEDQLVSFETAKLAKEKGFPFIDDYSFRWYDEYGKSHSVQYPGDESLSTYFIKVFLKDGTQYNGCNDNKNNPIIKYKDNLYLAPTQSLLQKWLREIYRLHLYVEPLSEDNLLIWSCKISRTDIYNKTYESFLPSWVTINEESYEEALEKGLQKALKQIS